MGDVLSGLYQIGCQSCDFIINIVTGDLNVVAAAVKQADAHGNGAYIQVLMFDHLIGFDDLGNIDHKPLLTVFFVNDENSDSMHLVKDVLTLTLDLDSFFVADEAELFCHLVELSFILGYIDNHHHVEKLLHDGLGNVKNVDVMLCQISTYRRDNSDSVFTDNGDDGSVHLIYMILKFWRKDKEKFRHRQTFNLQNLVILLFFYIFAPVIVNIVI